MINASGPSGSPVPATTPSTTAPVMAAPLTAATTPPAAGNAPVTSSTSDSSLKKPKKKLPWKMIVGVTVLILILIGAIAGYFLTQTSQDVRQQAAGDLYYQEQCIALRFNGNKEARLKASQECNANGGTWNDEACNCLTGQQTAGCFTTKDKCATQTATNCTSEPNFSSLAQCKAAREETVGLCYTTKDNCATQTATNCTSDPNFETLTKCTNALESSTSTSTTTTTTTTTQQTSTDASGTGSCSQCLGLGGQAERDCYAQCSGTIQTGICAGMNVSQCQSACQQAGGNPQTCTGTQEGAGGARAGEFLSCTASYAPVNGCGQFDCLDSSNNLIGFVIDNSQCSATGGTQTTTTQQSSSPLSSQVAQSSPSPAITASPSPVPSPTLNPELSSCNETCETSADCADILHSCQGGVCRLTDYPDSETCSEPSGATPTPVPRTEETPLECNDPCTSDNDCSTFNHVCHNNRCRLSTNLDNVSCTAPAASPTPVTELGQMTQQPDAPTTLPSAGASDLKNWLLTGLGAVGVGALILLLL